jgi:hypothetical protein
MVSVNLALPAATDEGLKLVIKGVGGVMVKTAGADVPPAAVTVMLTEPAVAIRLAGTAAVSVAPPKGVAANGVLPKLMVAEEEK